MFYYTLTVLYFHTFSLNKNRKELFIYETYKEGTKPERFVPRNNVRIAKLISTYLYY